MHRLASVATIITRARPQRSEAAPPAMLPNTLTRCASAASAMPAPCHAAGTSPDATPRGRRAARPYSAISSQQWKA